MDLIMKKPALKSTLFVYAFFLFTPSLYAAVNFEEYDQTEQELQQKDIAPSVALTNLEKNNGLFSNDSYKQNILTLPPLHRETQIDKKIKNLFQIRNLRSLGKGTEMTINATDGEAAANELLKGRLSPTQIKTIASTSRPCEGEQKEESGRNQEEIRKCFFNTIQAQPEDTQYIPSFNFISSLTDNKYRHKCIVSTIDNNLWITAAHCVPTDYLQLNMSILVDSLFVPLEANSVSWCKSKNCDIATIKLKTPKFLNHDFPKKRELLSTDYWKEHLIIAGLPEGQDLMSLRDPSDYKKQLLWAPVGNSFCMIMKNSDDGFLIHGCSTLKGFSGSPLYQKSASEGKFEITGIHSGTNDNKEEPATGIKRETNLKINYASKIKGEGI